MTAMYKFYFFEDDELKNPGGFNSEHDKMEDAIFTARLNQKSYFPSADRIEIYDPFDGAVYIEEYRGGKWSPAISESGLIWQTHKDP